MTSPPPTSAIGLVVHPRADVSESVRTIVAAAGGRGVRVLAQESAADRVGPGIEMVPDDQLVSSVDGIVSLGGDGTMLGAMRMTVGTGVPVLGVNHGNLGFLVEVSPADLADAIERLASEEVSLEPHDCLEARLHAVDPVRAFNDLTLVRDGLLGAASLDLSIGGASFGYYRADALVLSTPTGSTAYNYAAGGPILSPGSHVNVLTPVAPMNGISRSMVLAAHEDVRLTVTEDSSGVVLMADGVEAGRLSPGEHLDVTSIQDAAHVVRLDAAGHLRRSHVKLSMLDLPLRREQLAEMIPERERERLRR